MRLPRPAAPGTAQAKTAEALCAPGGQPVPHRHAVLFAGPRHPPELLQACIQAGTLYESRKYQNCVFVGRDPTGRARFACLRGTRDSFKIDVEGSDKRYNFSLLAADPVCPRLAVAESPIDALSLATLVKRFGGEWRDSHYLSLGGTAPRAMLQFLHDHPHVTHLSLCLDNDKAGMEGMERLETAIRQLPELAQRMKLIHHNPPPKEFGKDYNEFLCAHIQAERMSNRKKVVEHQNSL